MYLVIRIEGDGLKGKRAVEKRCEAEKPDELWRQVHEFVNNHEPEASDIFGRGDEAHSEYEREQRTGTPYRPVE